MAPQRRLNLPRLNTEATQLDLLIRPAEKVQNPVATPPRQVPGAVHPAPRTTKRISNKPLARQTPTVHIAPRKARSRNVKLPSYPSRYRRQTTVQHINTRVPDRATNGKRLSVEIT